MSETVSHLRLVPPPEPDKLAAFLSDLTALSEKHGIAISDGIELYEMEPEDRLFAYRADGESRLSRA